MTLLHQRPRTWRAHEVLESGHRVFLDTFTARPGYAAAKALLLWPELHKAGRFFMERDPDELSRDMREGARGIAEVRP